MKKTTLALLLSVAATHTYADNFFSFEVMVGNTDQETSFGSDLLPTEGDDNSTGVRASYLINENFAAELTYQNYGEISSSFFYGDIFGTLTETVETTALSIGLKGTLPLENGLSITARAGMSRWDYSLEDRFSDIPELVFTLDEKGSDIYYGVGLEYEINSKVFVGLEYSILEFDETSAIRLEGETLDHVDFDHEISNLLVSAGVKF